MATFSNRDDVPKLGPLIEDEIEARCTPRLLVAFEDIGRTLLLIGVALSSETNVY